MKREILKRKHEREVDRLELKIKNYGYSNGYACFANIGPLDIFHIWHEMDLKNMYYSDLYYNLEGLKTIKDLFDFIEGFEV